MPAANSSSCNSGSPIEKCCHKPGRSVNLRSTTWMPRSRTSSITSFAVFGGVALKLPGSKRARGRMSVAMVRSCKVSTQSNLGALRRDRYRHRGFAKRSVPPGVSCSPNDRPQEFMMDVKLHLLESFDAPATDGRTYKVLAYERLVRDESLPGAERWEPTGVSEYHLDDGRLVDMRAEGSIRI